MHDFKSERILFSVEMNRSVFHLRGRECSRTGARYSALRHDHCM